MLRFWRVRVCLLRMARKQHCYSRQASARADGTPGELCVEYVTFGAEVFDEMQTREIWN